MKHGMMHILKRLLPYVRPHGGRLALLLGLALGQMGLQMLRPWPVKWAIDGMIEQKNVPGWLTWLIQQTGQTTALVLLAASFVAMIALSGLLSILTLYHGVKLGHAMVGSLRSTLYEHLQKLSICFHKKQAMGDLIKRVAVDTFSIQSLVNNQGMPTVIACLMIVSMLTIMFWMHWLMALLSMAVVPLLSLTILRISRRVEKDASEAQEADSKVYQTVQEGLAAIALVQATNQESHQVRGFQSASDRGLKANLRLYMTQGRFSFIVEFITGLGTASLLFVGVRAVQSGQLTTGDLWVFLAYLASLYGPVNTIAQNITWGQASVVALRRVFEVLDKQPDVQDRTHPAPLPRIAGELSFENITFGYEPNRPVLKNVSFKVSPGEKIAVVGSTGSGKTTLLGLAMRFFDPQQGRVLLDGRDIRDFRLSDVRSQMTLVLQDPVLLAASVYENLRFGMPDRTDQEVMDAARKACAHDFVSSLPEHYSTVLAQAGTTLSGGQRQRLGIARAFLRNAPIVLLDEPTSALDASTESLIMGSLASYLRARTCLIVTHRLLLARQADQIVVMHEGTVAEIGSHERLLRKGGVYAQLWEDAQRPAVETVGSSEMD